MFSVFMELVKRVGIFVIIGQTVLHFGISQKYEKYMKLVISFMVAAQIIFAFGVYLRQDDERVHIMSATEYLKRWENSMEEMEKKMEESQEAMAQGMEKEVQQWKGMNAGSANSENSDIRIEKIVIQ